jgi:negative regulator of sigma E activity
MSRDLEKGLREALRPVDPGEDFTRRVLARLAAEPPTAAARGAGVARFVPGRRLWIPLALTASLVAAVVLGVQWHERRELRGLEARRELIEALRVTNQKLDLAYRLVNRPRSSGTDDDSGA